MLALAYPGTTPAYWENEPDEYLATALDVLEQMREGS